MCVCVCVCACVSARVTCSVWCVSARIDVCMMRPYVYICIFGKALGNEGGTSSRYTYLPNFASSSSTGFLRDLSHM
jgi:hypothetical protein